jgi:hypothetical protein
MPEVSATEAHPPARPHGGSKGVALTNWLVAKATGVLERKTSRRGFLIGSAMAGSAVAVAGCMPAVKPGSSYTHITDCAGGLCTDGYTEFCCTINDGLNACPPNSFWGGWWRADYSSFCHGTRYYIDCMQTCCGPATGYQNFCAGCEECRCAVGCDTRHIYCNYFRYGQCHTEIVASGPIACRVVTCVPPYAIDPACGTATLVDNATAEHTSPCITALPPATVLPKAGAVATLAGGGVAFFGRGADLFVNMIEHTGSTWGFWSRVAPPVTSGIAAANDATGTFVIGRGADNQLRYNKLVSGNWTGEGVLPGVVPTSDPCTATDGNTVWVFVRKSNQSISAGQFVNGTWTGWTDLGGGITSNPAAIAANGDVFLFGRGLDAILYANLFDGTTWSGWRSLGVSITSDPTVVADATTVYVFARQAGRSINLQMWSGGHWLAPTTLPGIAGGDPVATAGPDGMYVFVRALDGSMWLNRQNQGPWTGFTPLGGIFDTDAVAVGDATGVYALSRTSDSGIWTGKFANGAWSGWHQLYGSIWPATATF